MGRLTIKTKTDPRRGRPKAPHQKETAKYGTPASRAPSRQETFSRARERFKKEIYSTLYRPGPPLKTETPHENGPSAGFKNGRRGEIHAQNKAKISPKMGNNIPDKGKTTTKRETDA